MITWICDMLILVGGYIVVSVGAALALCWYQTRRDLKEWRKIQYKALHPSEFMNRDGSPIEL